MQSVWEPRDENYTRTSFLYNSRDIYVWKIPLYNWMTKCDGVLNIDIIESNYVCITE